MPVPAGLAVAAAVVGIAAGAVTVISKLYTIFPNRVGSYCQVANVLMFKNDWGQRDAYAAAIGRLTNSEVYRFSDDGMYCCALTSAQMVHLFGEEPCTDVPMHSGSHNSACAYFNHGDWKARDNCAAKVDGLDLRWSFENNGAAGRVFACITQSGYDFLAAHYRGK